MKLILYLKIIFSDLVIISDEVTGPTKTASIDSNDEKSNCKMDNFYVLLVLFLITTLQFIIVSI